MFNVTSCASSEFRTCITARQPGEANFCISEINVPTARSGYSETFGTWVIRNSQKKGGGPFRICVEGSEINRGIFFSLAGFCYAN